MGTLGGSAFQLNKIGHPLGGAKKCVFIHLEQKHFFIYISEKLSAKVQFLASDDHFATAGAISTKLYQKVGWPKGSSMGFKILVTPTPRGVRGDFW